MPPDRHADVSASDVPARTDGSPSPQEQRQSHGQMQDHQMMQGYYAHFGAMILTSTAVMLVLMYSLVLEGNYLRFSDMRFLMALYIGATTPPSGRFPILVGACRPALGFRSPATHPPRTL